MIIFLTANYQDFKTNKNRRQRCSSHHCLRL